MDTSKTSLDDLRRLAYKEAGEADSGERIADLLTSLRLDARKGAHRLADSLEAELKRASLERDRINGLKEYERRLYERGFKLIAGVDEVGRGPLFGPVVSVAVIMPPDSAIPGVNDSKKLTAKSRQRIAELIRREAIAIGIGIVDNETIDRVNIYQATRISMMEAVADLTPSCDCVVTDAMSLELDVPMFPVIGGDASVYSVSAASIVAKTVRDEMMAQYALEYPGYMLESNKGYASQAHIDALRVLGPTKLHRMSFLSGILAEKNE
jgi:ribonuclease HII